MNRTKIEWCDFTWNPVIGCRGACPYCYARKMAARFHLGREDFLPWWSQANFERPFPRRPARIFVNSMSDVADWDYAWWKAVAGKIIDHPEHLFLFLSKRPWMSWWDNWPNAMLGISLTCESDRIRFMGHGGRRDVSFVSLEPLLGPVNLSDAWRPRWIIVGAETGNRKAKVRPSINWLYDIRDFAARNHVPLFFKESLRELWQMDTALDLPQEFPSRSACEREEVGA